MESASRDALDEMTAERYRAATRQSLRAAQDRLDEVVSSAGIDDLRVLSDELFSVLDVLSSERVLRRHLADASTEPDARRQLVDTLFGGKIGQQAQTVLADLAASRWSASTDLLDALEQLAREVALATAQRADAIENVEDELFRFGRILDANPALHEALSNDNNPVAGRVELLDGLVAGKVHPVTKLLLDQAVRLPRTASLEVVVGKLAELAAARRNRSVAHVLSAGPLTGEQEQRLARILAEVFGREISVQVELDPELLGGLVIRVGDEVIDGSIAARLNKAREELPN
ncbi:MAG TPA: F0F1 ATP synthase subunit delta [Pseudonocardiaceae bacterium]|jgi:F-type H+-transporting ATPase subunit delta|nr:F0F1 ATP synthase subunit delta [Pseudonocardiaceae bacterium]